MKKMMMAVALAMVLFSGQSAFADDALTAVATAVGKGVAASMGQANGVVNVTTTTKGSKISGNNVDVGVVEAKSGNANAVINVTTVGGEVKADETARVGVVETK